MTHDAVAGMSIRGRAPDGSEQKHRNQIGKVDQSEQRRRTRQTVNQPALGHGLHPRAAAFSLSPNPTPPAHQSLRGVFAHVLKSRKQIANPGANLVQF